MAEKVKRIALGETEALAVLFGDANGLLYVCTAEEMGDLETRKKYGDRVRNATPVQLDGCGKGYFAFWVQDCFDPPIAIVRADHFGEAHEIFLSELPWADCGEGDLPADPMKLPEGSKERQDAEHEWEHYEYTDRKTWAYTETIGGREVRLARADFV